MAIESVRMPAVGWVETLKKMLVEMADTVQSAVDMSCKAFFSGDEKLAAEVLDLEDRLDRKEVQIEEFAVSILEREKPSGYYLRFLISVLKINNDLERMGDLAADICHATMNIRKHRKMDAPALLPMMVDRTRHLCRKSITSLLNEDMGVALQVRGEDIVIDRYSRELLAELSQKGVTRPDTVPTLMNILLVVRSVERIADLATNIAEGVIYLVEGTIVRHSGHSS